MRLLKLFFYLYLSFSLVLLPVAPAFAYVPEDNSGDEEQVLSPTSEVEEPEAPELEPELEEDFDNYTNDTPMAETEESDVPPEPEPIETEQAVGTEETGQETEVAQPEQSEPTQLPKEEQPNELEPQPVESVEPEVSPSDQIEEERQAAALENEPELPEPVQDFIDAVGINPIVDEDSQDTLLENYSDAAGALASKEDETESAARAEQDEGSLARGPLARLGEAAEVITDAPAETIDTMADSVNAVEDTINAIADPLQQFVDNREQTALDKQVDELDEEEQARLEAERQAIEAALDAPVEDRVQPIAQALGLAEDTSSEQVIDELNNQLAQSGIKIEGALDSFTLTEVPIAKDELTEQVSLALTLPPQERNAELERIKQHVLGGAEFVANLASQDFYNVLKHTAELQFNELPRIEQLKTQAGFDNSYIRDNTTAYLEEIKGLQKLTPEQIEQQIQGYFASLTEEEARKAADQLKAKKEYADALKELQTKTQDLQQEAQITGALALAGYLPVDQLAAPAIKRVAQGIDSRTGLFSRTSGMLDEARDFVGGLFGRGTKDTIGAVEAALKNTQPVYALPERNAQLRHPPVVGIEVPSQVEPFKGFGSLPRETWSRASTLAQNYFPNESLSGTYVIANYLDRGLSEEEIVRLVGQADQLSSLLTQTGGSISTDPNLPLFRVWETYRYNSAAIVEEGVGQTRIAGFIGVESRTGSTTGKHYSPVSPVGVLAALAQHEHDIKSIGRLLEFTEESLRLLTDDAIAHGASSKIKDFAEGAVDPSIINITDNITAISPAARGHYAVRSDTIAIKRSGFAEDPLDTCVHECGHRITERGRKATNTPTTPYQLINAYGGVEELVRRDPDNYLTNVDKLIRHARNLDEGMNQWVSDEAEILLKRQYPELVDQARLAGKEFIVEAIMHQKGVTQEQAEILAERLILNTGERPYSHQVRAMDEIVGTMQAKLGTSLEEVRAIIVEAHHSGDYSRLISSAGGINQVIEALEKIPPDEDALTNVVNAAITKKSIQDAEARVQQTIRTGSTSVGSQSNSFLNTFFIKKASAAGTKTTSYIDQGVFEHMVKVQLVKDGLVSEKKIDIGYLEQAISTSVLDPRFYTTERGYLFSTGASGSVESRVYSGSYTVVPEAVVDVGIRLPASIEIVGNSKVVVPIAVKEGKGEVKRVSSTKSQQQPWTAYAADISQSLGTVEFITFYDKNANGKWDKNEHSVPWANVQVELKKVNQDKLVSLLPGWNLLTLTAVPSKPLTASGLVSEIARQEGYATTVSALENGSWKSFIQRGDKEFTGEDFAIEPGKAYFVKALKRSVFLYQGQEFVEPVKLSLDSGWNAVGLPKTTSVYKIGDLFDKARPLFAEGYEGARWESGLWDTFAKQEKENYGHDFDIENNRGYIIRLDNKVNFVP